MNNLLKGLLAVIGIGGVYYYLTSNKKDSNQKENDAKISLLMPKKKIK
jgi:hypothetical protein